MDRDIIISKVYQILKKAQTEQEFSIPQIPKNLLNPKTKREIDYFKYIKDIHKLIDKDSLTGLSTKTKEGLGVYIFIDGDGLKKINDTLGHEAGTATIKALTKGIKSALRRKDNAEISRTGGDEFIVKLEAISTVTGVKIANRILDSIHKQDISEFYKGDEDVKEKLSKISLKASLGVGKTKEEADKAMYKAKEKGRNRVEFHNKKDS